MNCGPKSINSASIRSTRPPRIRGGLVSSLLPRARGRSPGSSPEGFPLIDGSLSSLRRGLARVLRVSAPAGTDLLQPAGAGAGQRDAGLAGAGAAGHAGGAVPHASGDVDPHPDPALPLADGGSGAGR